MDGNPFTRAIKSFKYREFNLGQKRVKENYKDLIGEIKKRINK